MFVYRVIVLALVLSIIGISLTQIIMPYFMGLPYFWWFRREKRSVGDLFRMAEIAEDLIDKEKQKL